MQDELALSSLDISTWSPDVTPAPKREPGSAFFNDRTHPDDVLVADCAGLVVGYVLLHHPTTLASNRHVLVINGLAVAPAHQGHGVGRRLVEGAKREAERRGARKLSLRVLSPNVLEGEVVEWSSVGDVSVSC